jgi:hypothetical protein
MAHQVMNLSKQYQKIVIQFLAVEGCQHGELHRQICVAYGAAHVLKTTVVDCLSMCLNEHARLQQAQPFGSD